jgi:hypothetical protein
VNAVGYVVVPGETGVLFPRQRPDRLAVALRFLLDTPAAAGRMADAARRRLGDSYGVPALRDALAAAYAPATGGPVPVQSAPQRILEDGEFTNALPNLDVRWWTGG